MLGRCAVLFGKFSSASLVSGCEGAMSQQQPPTDPHESERTSIAPLAGQPDEGATIMGGVPVEQLVCHACDCRWSAGDRAKLASAA